MRTKQHPQTDRCKFSKSSGTQALLPATLGRTHRPHSPANSTRPRAQSRDLSASRVVHRLLVCLQLTCFTLLLGLATALAQSGSPAQMADPHGDQPFGSYQLGDIDQIGFANGALDVVIPLFGHAGRGITHQKFWSYTNKTWFQDNAPPCDPTILECPPPDPPFWMYADNTTTFSSNTRYITGCGNGHQQQEDADYTYVDEHGTPHVFDVVTSPISPVQSQCIHLKPIGYALDGSGMKVDVTDFVHPVVTLKDGTRIMGDQSGFPAFLRKDANGNMITAAGNPSTGLVNGETDTLGRAIQYATGTLPDGAEYEDWIANDSNGNQQKARIEWVRLPVCTNFGGSVPNPVEK